MKPRSVLIVAGEASADLHASNLVKAMKRLDSGILFCGIGGHSMKAQGVRILVPCSEMAVVGLTEVLPRLHTIAGAYGKLKTILKRDRPDLLILIDYPDFNIMLAKVAKRYGVPVLYYISPQVWAWRTRRLEKLRRRIDRLAVIFPFEESFFRRMGLGVDYVGHPLLDVMPPRIDKSTALRELGIEGASPVIGLIPGSRKEEVVNLLPAMVEAAVKLRDTFPDLKCLLPRASSISEGVIASILRNKRAEILVTEGDIYRVLSACDFAFVASGTATLETAVMQVPMVILYRVSPLSYWIGKRVIKVPSIGLPNLVAQKKIVIELIQNEVTSERLTREALSLLGDQEKRDRMIKELKEVREKLGTLSASQRTAQIAFEMITSQKGGPNPGYKVFNKPMTTVKG
ncbi:MAG: lipid-A-disaccharide synthase [Deltaproteobacteria bacterium]|nr:lipid-A-disaccharide synthase [Deltaproteobacteria bacterium]